MKRSEVLKYIESKVGSSEIASEILSQLESYGMVPPQQIHAVEKVGLRLLREWEPD